MPLAITHVAEGARGAGRDPGEVTIACMLRVCVDEDLERAREGARATIPPYLAFSGYARYLSGLGYVSIVRSVTDSLARGDVAGATRQVPDELVDRTLVYGSVARCRARVDEYRRTGVQLPVILARPAEGVPWREALGRTLDALAPRPA